MAEFAFLAYYKDHPEDKAMAMAMSNPGLNGYEKLPRRQRGASMCSTLTPVMEHETDEVQKKSKRRFSLDFLFSKKKKQLKVKENAKRASVDSTASVECDNGIQNPNLQRRKSSAKEAELSAYCFS